MPSQHTRISIIGCGHVGTSCAYAILQNHLAREIVLIGGTEEHVHGEALDLQQAVPLGAPIKIFAGCQLCGRKPKIAPVKMAERTAMLT